MGQSQSRRDSSQPERRRQRLPFALHSSALFTPSSRHTNDESRSRRRSWILSNTHDADEPQDLGNSPPPQAPDSSSRRSRISRSFTSTIPSFLQRDRNASWRFPHRPLAEPPLYNEVESSQHGSNGSLLPTVPQVPSLDINFDEISTDSDHANSTEQRRPTQRSATSMSDRASSLTAARPFRNLTASLRRRRPQPNRGDESAATLARLLSITAAATAASLMGVNSDAHVTDSQETAAVVDDDGSFDGFLQAIRAGGLQAALGRRQSTGSEGEANNPNPAALEFFRMFRFGSQGRNRNANNSDSGTQNRSESDLPTTEPPRQTAQTDEGNNEGRMVPVLIVGIRSFNAELDPQEGNAENNMPSFLDAITNSPTTINIGLSDGSNTGTRQSRSGVRVSSRRRASMGGLNLFSGARDSARRARQNDAQRPRSEYRALNRDTPPGPFPPPTTPSSPPVSGMSSGISTPNGRTSPNPTHANSRSTLQRNPSTSQGHSHLEPPSEESATPSRSARQRRRSESDFRRYGPGSSRRHGTYLEPPEHSESQNESASSNRSWIIYILGGSYPEDHPILTTPSLFTDSPTYEDLLLLSSLIGPAKPPVATAEDVASAGGLYNIRRSAKGGVRLQHGAAAEAEWIPLVGGERCLVCLSDYQEDEEARRLAKCNHVFHRECIDQWLTTGRNSCPLCRGQGVEEQQTAEANPSTPTEATTS